MQGVETYKLPTSGVAREKLREKGQFWTPDWVAEAMVEYVLTDTGITLFDPAVGAGAFFLAAKKVVKEKGFDVALAGMDIDSDALDQATRFGLTLDDVAHVKVGDFICESPSEKLSAIVANPPYIRHHRLAPELKEQLRRLSLQTTGNVLDGRAGLHIYFLIRALTLLAENGRLAFIMPADTCEGKFANDLWRWIAANFALEAVVTFAPKASPFPKVDTNPLIFFICNTPPEEHFQWAICCEPQTAMLKEWVQSGFAKEFDQGLTVVQRELHEGLETGLSRLPKTEKSGKYILGDFVQVVRGVATGSNDFFFLTEEQKRKTGIPDCYFVRAVGRTRDVPGDEITQETLTTLQTKGRPTFLLALNGDESEGYPKTLKNYLWQGEALGLPKRPLISQRKPWYKTESRQIPPFLFAYLGRRNVRFIRNTAGIIPLTSFLCLYPKSGNEEHLERLWRILNHPDTVANLAMIGKSYGDGAIKVEPRALERLPVPDHVIAAYGLPLQLRLLEEKTEYDTTTTNQPE